MQETTNPQQTDAHKVGITFKCSPSIRAQLLTKAAQLGVTLSALCEDYIIAGINAASTPPKSDAPPAEKPERTLTDMDLKLIQSEVEQAFLSLDAANQDEEGEEYIDEPETDEDDSAAPVLALLLTPAQRTLCDEVNDYRRARKIPALEDSAAEILSGYAMHTYGNGEFKDTNGLSMTAFKKAMREQDDNPGKAA